MRRILFFLSLITLTTITTNGQGYTPVSGNWQYFNLKVINGLGIPTDTLSTAPINSIATKGTTLYIKLSTGHWTSISGGGGSGAIWGVNITGTIGSQTDLIALLGAKRDSSHRNLDTLYAITDSTFAYYTNGTFHTFKALGAVQRFNGRIGAIVLTQLDVQNAVGWLPLAPADTIGRWLGSLTINGTNDSLIYFKGSTRGAIKLPTGGSSFDSATSQGGGFHTLSFNDARYLRRQDSLNNYVTPKRLADSAASLRGLISSGFDSATSQSANTSGGFHTRNYNDARYIKSGDSGVAYVTPKNLKDTAAALRTAIAAGDSAVNAGTFTKKTVTGTTIVIDVDTSKLPIDTLASANGIKLTHSGNITTISGDSLMRNIGNSTGVNSGPFLSRPAASNCKCYYWSTDSIFYSYDNGLWKDLKPGATGGAVAVNNGIYDSAGTKQLGEPLGTSLNPSKFFANREIPLNGKSLTFWDTANNVKGGRLILNDTQYTSLVGNVKVQMRQFSDSASGAHMWNTWYPRNYGYLYAGGKPNGAPMKSLGWSFGYSENVSLLPAPDNVFGGGYNIVNATARADTGDAALSLRVESNYQVLGAFGAFEMHWPELTKFNGTMQRVNSWYMDKNTGNTLWESNLNDHEYKRIFQRTGLDWLQFNSNGDDYPSMHFWGTHNNSLDGDIIWTDSTGTNAMLRSLGTDLEFYVGSNLHPLQLNFDGSIYLNNTFTTSAPTKNTIIGNYDDGSFPTNVASAQFAVVGQHKGMLPPVMTTTQMNAISSPANGLLIYNSTASALYVYNSTAWLPLASGGSVSAAGPSKSVQIKSATTSTFGNVKNFTADSATGKVFMASALFADSGAHTFIGINNYADFNDQYSGFTVNNSNSLNPYPETNAWGLNSTIFTASSSSVEGAAISFDTRSGVAPIRVFTHPAGGSDAAALAIHEGGGVEIGGATGSDQTTSVLHIRAGSTTKASALIDSSANITSTTANTLFNNGRLGWVNNRNHKDTIAMLSDLTGSSFYQIVQSNLSSQTQRAKLNFSTDFTLADNSGNGSTDVSISTTKLTSGSSQPTATGVTNVSSVGSDSVSYIKVGNIVTGRFSGNITPTAPGAVAFTVPVPITNVTWATQPFCGTGTAYDITSGLFYSVTCNFASATTVTIAFSPTATHSHNYIVSYQYDAQ